MKIVLAITFAVLVCSVQCDPFTVKISTKGEYKVGEDIKCDVTIANTYDRDYYLLARNTPLEGLRSSIFSVAGNGRVLRYDGMLLKRGPPSKDVYVFVKAKSSVSASVDLSRVFSFNSTGAYSVQLTTSLQYFEDRPANISTQQVSSNMEVFTLLESKSAPKPTEGELIRRNATRVLASPLRAQVVISPAFGGKGKSSDKTTGTAAYKAAYNVMNKSYQSVTSKPSLYKKWFGRAYNGYTMTVQRNYLSIKIAMETRQYKLYFHGPECSPGDYAYTYFSSTTVYLCDSYFTAPTTGTDSKMGTIVHEMSHAVASTEDIVYGKTDCRALAARYPSQAINNADNYEYFSESL